MKILLLLSIVIELYYFSCLHLSAEVPVPESIAYSSNLYTELAKTRDTSFLISPFSLKIALGMLAAGADGNTHEEILRVLHIKDQSEVVKVVQNIENPASAKTDLPLTRADMCCLSHKISIFPTYVKSIALKFNSQVESIDFSKNTTAANSINRWIQIRTQGKIRDIVSRSFLTRNNFSQATSLVLINMLYFHDNWLNSFSKYSTKVGVFYKNSAAVLSVIMMSEILWASYKDSVELNAKFLKLSYKNKDYAMYVVIPKDVGGIKYLETHIEEILSTVLEDCYELYVSIHIPKFKMETSIDLIPVLEKLGMRDAFTRYANFSLISEGFVEVSKIIQKTFIEVNEEGTAAAAATIAIGDSVSGRHPIQAEFRADRPFIYYIKYKDEVLFVGRCNDPRDE